MATENEKVMITKQDELKALSKIRKILEVLGEDSYLASAFDGALNIAEQNIEFDAAFSAKFYIDEYDKARENEQALRTMYECEIRKLRNELEEVTSNYYYANERAEQRRKDFDAVVDHLGRVTNTASQDYEKRVELEREVAKLQKENLELKARLYDFITKED